MTTTTTAYDQYTGLISGYCSTRKNTNIIICDTCDEIKVYDYGTHYLLAFKPHPEFHGDNHWYVNQDRYEFRDNENYGYGTSPKSPSYSRTTENHKRDFTSALARAGYHETDTTTERDGYTFRLWTQA